MTVISDTSTYLMFNKKDDSIFPVVGSAFKISDGNFIRATRNLNKKNRGALIVSREGLGWMIQKIEVIGLHGETWGGKFLSALSGCLDIKTYFGNSFQMDISEFKNLAIHHLELDQNTSEPDFLIKEPLEKVIPKINQAPTFSDIFDLICVPSPAECLDVL